MPKRILIVMNETEAHCLSAVEEAIGLAAPLNAEIVFFTAIGTFEIPVADFPGTSLSVPGQFKRQAVASAKLLHAQARERAEAAGIRCFSIVSEGEDDSRTVTQASQRLDCDMIVVCSDQSNAVMRLLKGSLVPGLITRSDVPVLVVKAAVPGPSCAPDDSPMPQEVQAPAISP